MNRWTVGAIGLLMAAAIFSPVSRSAETKNEPKYDWQVSDERIMQPLSEQIPIEFVNAAQHADAWAKLPQFWNETTRKVTDPKTSQVTEQKVVIIKVPLGLTRNPPIPAENPMTVAKWKLGKKLYYDPILSSDSSVSCASCHDPARGFTDQARFSMGIRGQFGGRSAPTVMNSAYHALQFWDGRAASLEEQAQGPVGNPVEMFDASTASAGEPWHQAIRRLNAKPEYVEMFRKVFGHDPTRDAAAKAIAAYERTVLVGNSLADRAEVAMRERIEEAGDGKLEVTAKDFETVIRKAIAAKDENALSAIGVSPARDADKIPQIAQRIANGRTLFLNKARCSTCHTGDNFTDNEFHNLGVGAHKGKLKPDHAGRFASQPTGHKNVAVMGAFKTPTLRGLLSTAPYMHDGSEDSLEKVVDFYDRGGNANEFLSPRMRDFEAEKAYMAAKTANAAYNGPAPAAFDPSGKPVIPLKLNLSAEEKADLVLYLKSLQGDPVAAIVADPQK